MQPPYRRNARLLSRKREKTDTSEFFLAGQTGEQPRRGTCRAAVSRRQCIPDEERGTYARSILALDGGAVHWGLEQVEGQNEEERGSDPVEPHHYEEPFLVTAIRPSLLSDFPESVVFLLLPIRPLQQRLHTLLLLFAQKAPEDTQR